MIRNPNILRSLQKFFQRCNYSDSSKKNLPNNFVIFSEDAIVCWHPEPKFPYECTKPLPVKEPEPERVLKMSQVEAKKIFSAEEDRPIIAEELAKMTYTTKHIWFPKARLKRAKKTKPDRPYL